MTANFCDGHRAHYEAVTARGALNRSDLDPFPFADIGIEASESWLTMLSSLVTGEDSPAHAAIWSRSIARTPLERAVSAAHTTGSRLILLLPSALLAPDRLTTHLTIHWGNGLQARDRRSSDGSPRLRLSVCPVFWRGPALAAA